MVSVMEFAKPGYDTDTVDWAGDTLRDARSILPVYGSNGIVPEDVIYNWRVSHAYPLNTFQIKWLYVVGHSRLIVRQL